MNHHHSLVQDYARQRIDRYQKEAEQARIHRRIRQNSQRPHILLQYPKADRKRPHGIARHPFFTVYIPYLFGMVKAHWVLSDGPWSHTSNADNTQNSKAH